MTRTAPQTIVRVSCLEEDDMATSSNTDPVAASEAMSDSGTTIVTTIGSAAGMATATIPFANRTTTAATKATG